MPKLQIKPTMKKEHQTMQMNLWEAKAQADHEKRQTAIVSKFCKANRLLTTEASLMQKVSASVDRIKDTQRKAQEKMDKAHVLFKNGVLDDSDKCLIEANWLLNDARIHFMIELQRTLNDLEKFIKDNPNKIQAIYPQPK